jgi:ribosome-associated toxin RatA of RatAB toxin-antitoxin module
VRQLQGSGATSVAASPAACFALVVDVDGYPRWHPQVIRRAEALERGPDGLPTRVATTVHVAVGPLVRDFELTMDVAARPEREVRLTRVAHDPADPERFEVVWRVGAGTPAELELELAATLDVPRLVPLGGVGDRLAQGFVEAAKRELEGSSPKASASSS